jgi:hypothetical protein
MSPMTATRGSGGCQHVGEARRLPIVPSISQETLAEMIGTTRERVNFFMNKFRKLGFLHYNYNGGLRIYSSLLSVVLNDSLDKRNQETSGNSGNAQRVDS